MLDHAAAMGEQEVEAIGQQRQDEIVIFHAEFRAGPRQIRLVTPAAGFFRSGLGLASRTKSFPFGIGAHVQADQRTKIEFQIGLVGQTPQIAPAASHR